MDASSKNKKKCDVRYSQLLYRVNDCIGAFVIALLKREDIEEVLFWASEIILSGYPEKFYKLLLNIYFDFYAIDYPKFEKFIVKNILRFQETKNPTPLFLITINLFHKWKLTYHIFHYTHFEFKKEPKYLKKNCSPFLKSLKLNIEENTLEEKFLIHIHDFHQKKTNQGWLRIIFLTRKIFDDKGYQFIIDLLKKYFKECRKHKIYSNLPKKLYTFKSHLISGRDERENAVSFVLINLFNDIGFKHYNTGLNHPNISTINDKLLCFLEKIKLPDVYYSKSFHPSTATKKQIIDKTMNSYRILDKYRLYSIPPEINCFRQLYAPFKPGRLTHEFKRLSEKWMYYCHLVPFWKEKFDLYEYHLNHKKKTLSFYSEDDFEEFSLWFNFEPDECSACVKFKSLVWYKNKLTTDDLKKISNIEQITNYLVFSNKTKIKNKALNMNNGLKNYLCD